MVPSQDRTFLDSMATATGAMALFAEHTGRSWLAMEAGRLQWVVTDLCYLLPVS